MPSALAAVLVLLTSAAVLVLEIIANRLVAPYVGLTLETTTAAIGVALAGIAAGSALGGRLADVVDPRRWLGLATALGGVLVLVARPTVLALGPSVGGGAGATIVLVTVAVLPAALVLTMVTPGVVKLRLRTLEETGATVGRLSATGTIGALAGTFLTGFVLLSALPTSRVLLVVGLVLVVLGVVVAVVLPTGRAVDERPLLGLLLLMLLGSGWLVLADSSCDRETRYYCARVVEDPDREGGRVLFLDSLRHSYVDLDDPRHLEFSYTQRIAAVLDAQPAGPLDALHLGLGGGTIPRYLADTRPGSSSRVLEVDPGVVDLDRDALGLVTGPDLTVRVGDARTSIADEPDDAYDVVVGDAFGSLAVPWHLATREMAEDIARVLREDGVYVANVIDNPPAAFVRAEVATLRAVFDEVLLVGTAGQADGGAGGNYVLVATDGALDAAAVEALGAGREQPWTVTGTDDFAGDADVLTDDDAPVDQLLTPYARVDRT